MERLTPAEEKVMLRLWSLEKAAVKDIVALYDQPRPAYNTISTIVRILEKKKFIKHKPVSRGHIYSPRISKEDYRNYLGDNLSLIHI
jgi:BlaI family penicillinase repressor